MGDTSVAHTPSPLSAATLATAQGCFALGRNRRLLSLGARCRQQTRAPIRTRRVTRNLKSFRGKPGYGASKELQEFRVT